MHRRALKVRHDGCSRDTSSAAGILSTLLLTVLAVAAAAGAQPSAAAYTVSIISPMTKISSEELGPVQPGRIVELIAARGEGESSQILVQATEGLHGVTVSASPLTGPGGSVVPLEIRLMGYVPIKNPAPGGFGKPGLYPDPLLPLRPFEVKAGGSQSLWITTWVPRQTPPGDYQGSITITPVNTSATTVSVHIRVAAVTLPAQSALRTHFDIWGFGGNPEWYGKADWDPRKTRFIETLLRYRISAPPSLPWSTVFAQGGDGTWTAHWQEFDRAVEEWMAKGTTFFVIRRQIFLWYGGKPPASVPEPEATAAKLRLLGAHLAERGWSDRFAFYLFDEPGISDDYPKPGDRYGSENVQKIKPLAAFIHQHAPNLRLMIVTCDPAYEAVALDFPAYLWCPHINHFHPDFQLRRKRMGEPNWMYVCVTTTHAPAFPDIWRIDLTGTAQRTIGSWLWRYQCDGFLYWCVDYWKKNPYETPDIFPMAGSNGDGFLFYPDPEKQADPFPSLRLELVRDGFEDYDLLTLLQKAADAIRANPMRAPAAQERLAEADRLLNLTADIPAIARYAKEPAVYETRHRLILEWLDRR